MAKVISSEVARFARGIFSLARQGDLKLAASLFDFLCKLAVLNNAVLFLRARDILPPRDPVYSSWKKFYGTLSFLATL